MTNCYVPRQFRAKKLINFKARTYQSSKIIQYESQKFE